jgi:plastocyanin
MSDAVRGLVAIALLGLSAAAYSATLTVSVIDTTGAPVANAVASLYDAKGLSPTAVKATTYAVMDQRHEKFVPKVLPVETGTWVRFPNSDQIHHEVYSFSPAKTFDLPLYKGQSAPSVLFDKPGVVTLGCNIHDWMIGYIVVVGTPYFAKSDATGHLVIANVPPGDYHLDVWQSRLVTAPQVFSMHVHVDAQGTSTQVRLALKSPASMPQRPADLQKKPGGQG